MALQMAFGSNVSYVVANIQLLMTDNDCFSVIIYS